MDEAGGATVFLFDKQPVLLEGLSLLLGKEGYQVCGQTSDVQDALDGVANTQPDLTITGLDLPEQDALHFIHSLVRASSRQRILIFSRLNNSETIWAALQLGVQGFVTKFEGFDSLKQGIRNVLSGRVHLSEQAAVTLKQQMSRRDNGNGDLLKTLSRREAEVFRLLGEGYGTGDVARLLGVSRRTVDSFCYRIKLKLGVEKATALRRLAIKAAKGGA